MLRRAMARNLFKQMGQFATVGGLGTVTNLIVFFVLVDIYVVAPLVGASVAFAIAVSQNYALNELWTFNDEGRNRIQGHRYLKFVFFSSIALGANLAVLQLLINQFDFPLLVIPQAIGILAATALNFLSSRLVTFR
jgi:putative flippase GtrA